MLVIDFMISAKFSTKCLKKFIFPLKDWITFLFLGMPILWIASTLYGSIFIISIDIMWPRSFLSNIEKWDFLDSRRFHTFYILEKYAPGVVDVRHHILRIQWCHPCIWPWNCPFTHKWNVHGPLEGGPYIHQTEGNFFIHECAPWGGEGCFLFVFFKHYYLVITRISTRHGNYVGTY